MESHLFREAPGGLRTRGGEPNLTRKISGPRTFSAAMIYAQSAVAHRRKGRAVADEMVLRCRSDPSLQLCVRMPVQLQRISNYGKLRGIRGASHSDRKSTRLNSS